MTSEGVHLIVLEELIQPQLDSTLRHQILSDLFSQWLKSQIEKFEVEIAPNAPIHHPSSADIFAT